MVAALQASNARLRAQNAELEAEILGGMLVSIRIEQNTLMFFDPATRVLLRTRPAR